jgi:hypothetical protein
MPLKPPAHHVFDLSPSDDGVLREPLEFEIPKHRTASVGRAAALAAVALAVVATVPLTISLRSLQHSPTRPSQAVERPAGVDGPRARTNATDPSAPSPQASTTGRHAQSSSRTPTRRETGTHRRARGSASTESRLTRRERPALRSVPIVQPSGKSYAPAIPAPPSTPPQAAPSRVAPQPAAPGAPSPAPAPSREFF